MPKNAKALFCMAIVIALGVMAAWPATASAKQLASKAAAQQSTIKLLKKQQWKSQSVLNFWKNRGRWALHSRIDKCWEITGKQRRQVCQYARESKRFHQRRLPRIEARIEKLSAPHDTGYLPPAQARELGRKMAAYFFGWTGEQWRCLDSLWGDHESSWRVHADNPTSGAYGIPQSYPGTKMASVGENWKTSAYVQIKWGLNYIKRQYSTPCSALSVRIAKNSY